MDVFGPISEAAAVKPEEETAAENLSLLGLWSERAIKGDIIAEKLSQASFDQVHEVVDRHLWSRFHTNVHAGQQNELSPDQREEFLMALGIQSEKAPAERRLSNALIKGDIGNIVAYINATIAKMRNNQSPPISEPKFSESKEDWYKGYCERQAKITYEYARLVAEKIVENDWGDMGISPPEFIFIAKPLSDIAANRAGYYKACRAAKSSIPILGTLVSDNHYAAAVKQLFLEPYLERWRWLEKVGGKKLW